MMEHPREAFGEYRAFGQNDELRWLEARGRFECDRDGRPKRYYGVLMDITERKRARGTRSDFDGRSQSQGEKPIGRCASGRAADRQRR